MHRELIRCGQQLPLHPGAPEAHALAIGLVRHTAIRAVISACALGPLPGQLSRPGEPEGMRTLQCELTHTTP
jgi:hypothetical protein